MIDITDNNGSVILTVRVVPRASKSGIVGEHDGALKVRIASPPVDGAANTELVKLLAKRFSISTSNIGIVSGQSAKTKRVRLTGATAAEIASVLKAKT